MDRVRGIRTQTVLLYAVMTVIAVIFLLPVVWMILSSFRLHEEIFRHTTLGWHFFIPEHWTLENYADVFLDEANPFGRFLLNTAFVATTVTCLGIFVNSMAAFAFAKMEFPFKKPLFITFLATLAIPYEVIMIPQYLLIQDLGWINTFQALIAPQIVWAFGVFLLVQFFREIPRDMIEAARIDGATWLQIYFRITLPSAVPALITLALITFVFQWDNFLWPLIVINENAKQVITVAIASYQTIRGISWGKIFAASTISSMPIVIIFLFLQRYYVKGVMMSGLKG